MALDVRKYVLPATDTSKIMENLCVASLAFILTREQITKASDQTALSL